MAQLVSLELIIFLGITIAGGLVYLLVTSYRNRRDDGDDDDEDNGEDAAEAAGADRKRNESDEDRAWRAKRFWWFGR